MASREGASCHMESSWEIQAHMDHPWLCAVPTGRRAVNSLLDEFSCLFPSVQSQKFRSQEDSRLVASWGCRTLRWSGKQSRKARTRLPSLRALQFLTTEPETQNQRALAAILKEQQGDHEAHGIKQGGKIPSQPQQADVAHHRSALASKSKPTSQEKLKGKEGPSPM